MKLSTLFFASSSIVVANVFFISPLWSSPAAEDVHQHAHGDHAQAGLTLNQGEKWPSDAALREGMQRINEVVTRHEQAFHQGVLTRDQAKQLAGHIEEQVAFLIANCKLVPQADATLHGLIGQMLQGAEDLSKDPLSSDGLPRVRAALVQYPDYFEHPGWGRAGDAGLHRHDE